MEEFPAEDEVMEMLFKRGIVDPYIHGWDICYQAFYNCCAEEWEVIKAAIFEYNYITFDCDIMPLLTEKGRWNATIQAIRDSINKPDC